jgi:acetylornithine/succinyldiaminopimelate/putrescine aminotransferase
MREQHIMTAVEGKHHNIIFLIPPLCFSEEDAKKFTNSLKNILDDIAVHPKETICENIAQGAERYSK